LLSWQSRAVAEQEKLYFPAMERDFQFPENLRIAREANPVHRDFPQIAATNRR